MMFADQPFKALGQDMRVYLGGRDVGMSQQFLHNAQIRTILQEMTGKGVTQDMRRDQFGGYAATRCQTFQIAGKYLPGQMA